MGIFTFLVNLLNKLFGATKDAWSHLPTQVQTDITNGSGIFSVLSQYIGQDAKLTIATIDANYPTESPELLYSGLAAVAKTWGLVVPDTLEDLVVVIQTHISSLDNTVWARVLSGAAQILADVLTGGSTPFEIIVSVIQWVYTNLVQGKELKLVTSIPGVIGQPLDPDTPQVAT